MRSDRDPGQDAMTDYELVSPADAAAWVAYHDIRRRVLFEAGGRFGDWLRLDVHAAESALRQSHGSRR